MAQTKKVWTVNHAHAYNGKSAISKFLVKRKVQVSPPIKKWGRRQTKKMRSHKNRKPTTICVDGDSGREDHHELQGRCHAHGHGHLSTEKTKRSLTNDNVESGIEYHHNGSGRRNMPLKTTTEATPSTAPMNNGIWCHYQYRCS